MKINFGRAVLILFIALAILASIQSIVFASSDLETLYQITEAEAGGESFEGKQLVVCVIMNRVADSRFPDTIEEVVFEPRQFQPIDDGRYWEVEPSKDTIKAVNSVIYESVFDRNVLFFQSTRLTKSWISDNRNFKMQVGGHNFYE